MKNSIKKIEVGLCSLLLLCPIILNSTSNNTNAHASSKTTFNVTPQEDNNVNWLSNKRNIKKLVTNNKNITKISVGATLDSTTLNQVTRQSRNSFPAYKYSWIINRTVGLKENKPFNQHTISKNLRLFNKLYSYLQKHHYFSYSINGNYMYTPYGKAYNRKHQEISYVKLIKHGNHTERVRIPIIKNNKKINLKNKSTKKFNTIYDKKMNYFNKVMLNARGNNQKIKDKENRVFNSIGIKNLEKIINNKAILKGKNDYNRGHFSLKYLPNPAYLFGMNNAVEDNLYLPNKRQKSLYSTQHYFKDLQKLVHYSKSHNVRLYRGINDNNVSNKSSNSLRHTTWYIYR